jgi:hypothetical protein
MKRSFELSRSRRANVWFDEAPPAAYTASSIVTKAVTPMAAIDAARTIAGVEVLIPRGSIHYALLGGELVEADVDGLEVSVFVNEAGAPFPTPLAGPPEKVRIGLLHEYADAVISGVTKVAETSGAPTRRQLRFGWAAHGLVGSSPWVFERASGIVLQLLMLRSDGLDDQVDGLFR